MIGSVPGDIAKHGFLPVRIAASIRRILLKLSSFRLSDMLSDDMKYALYFYRNYLPQLYRRHIKKNTRNCLFCSRLVKSECHRYCFKCSAGTYIKCSPPLPGLLYASSVQWKSGRPAGSLVFQNLFRLQKASLEPVLAQYLFHFPFHSHE